jgi:putative peptidoglycan lipid II flippase
MRKTLDWNFRAITFKLKRGVLINIFYSQAGNVTSVLASYIPLYLLSSFSSGILTALTYAQKTSEIPNQLITNQSSAVVAIKLNELHAQKNFGMLNDTFIKTTNFLLFILTPISGLLSLYSHGIIALLFQHGHFNSTSAAIAADFFKYFVLLLPMLAVNTMVARLFMAGQKILQSFLYQIIFNCLLIGMVVTALKVFGVLGYPIALIAVHILNVVACQGLLRLFFPAIRFKLIIIPFFKILVLNVCIFLVAMYLKEALTHVKIFVNIFVGFVSYATAVILANKYLVINREFNDVTTKANQFVKDLWKR